MAEWQKVMRYESLETLIAQAQIWEESADRNLSTFVRQFENEELGIVCGNMAWRGKIGGEDRAKLEAWLKERDAITVLGLVAREDILN